MLVSTNIVRKRKHKRRFKSDKFSFGGNSFGAQSVFDKPRMNSSINDMCTKGASMFMQYKVSKNIKVETRVSVSSHQSPWEP